MRTRIKICGVSRREDALLAAQLGAEYLGLVLTRSPRQVLPDQVQGWVQEVRLMHPETRWVGVFVRPSAAEVARATALLSLDLIQVHGLARNEGCVCPRPWIRAFPVERTPSWPEAERESAGLEETRGESGSLPWALLVDSPSEGGAGGTGRAFNWDLLPRRERSFRLFLAGGLAADNVGEAIRQIRPFAVDASSRLESAPGRKDPERLTAFIAAVRRADADGADTP